MTDHTLPRATSLGVPARLNRLHQRVSHWLKRRRLYRLQQLDDHLLNDIGLLREEVEAALQQPLSIDPIRDLNQRARTRRVCGPRFRFR